MASKLSPHPRLPARTLRQVLATILNRSRAVLEWRWGLRVIVEFTLVILLIGVGYWTLNRFTSPVYVLSTISASAESVSFKVSAKEMAAFPVRQMQVRYDSSRKGGCVNGLFTPTSGARVKYLRTGYGPLVIQVDPPPGRVLAGTIDSGPQRGFDGRVWLEPGVNCGSGKSGDTNPLHQEVSSCGLEPFANSPLPIWGDATVGSEQRPARGLDDTPDVVLSGNLSVSARSNPILASIVRVNSTLYPVTNLELPVGSRLQTAPGGNSTDTPQANWWGAAYCDPDKAGLAVQMSTDTPRLAIYHPNAKDPDIVEVTAMTQIFTDPAYATLARLAAISSIILWVFELIRKHRTTKPDNTLSE